MVHTKYEGSRPSSFRLEGFLCVFIMLVYFASLAAEGAMCIFHTFEKNAFKDLQPREKSGL